MNWLSMLLGMEMATILFLLYSLACTPIEVQRDPWDDMAIPENNSNTPPVAEIAPIDELPPKTVKNKKINKKNNKKKKKPTKRELDGL